MIVLLYGIHLANILSSRLALMVCSTWPLLGRSLGVMIIVFRYCRYCS
jgi:hypothetical protein